MAHVQGTFTRRQFIQAAAAGSLALAGMGSSRVSWAQAVKPNIVFIMADDLGYADVSCYGQRDYMTPNVDRLAIEGLKFTQGYANSAVCSPTRTALITGRYQYRLAAGLEETINLQSPKNAGLPPDHPTLPSLLKKVGYATTLIGKWHLGFLPDFSPLKSGYDHFFGIWGGASDYFNHGPGSPAPLYEDEVPVERHGYMTNLLGDRAVKTVEAYAKSKEPFLLSVHFTAPHWPWEGPNDEAESKRIKGRLRHYDGGTQKTYISMVQSLDANIGRVLQALDVQGLAENTIVIFTSDNGGERFSKIWPFSGMKSELSGRRPSRSRHRALAGASRVGIGFRTGYDFNGLDADTAGRRRNPNGFGLSARRRKPSADTNQPSGTASAQALLALQGRNAARCSRWRLEVPADRRQRVPV
jgi:arylsulfatase A-like enzyme